MTESKPFCVSKWAVLSAWARVRDNKGAAGVDDVSIDAFEGKQCKLEAHPEKTRIVYCRDSSRRQEHEQVRFDSLGYSFRPREAKNRWGKLFTSFLPAISTKAKAAIIAVVRDWHVHRMGHLELDDLARMFNAKIRGWVNYWLRQIARQQAGLFAHWQVGIVP